MKKINETIKSETARLEKDILLIRQIRLELEAECEEIDQKILVQKAENIANKWV